MSSTERQNPCAICDSSSRQDVAVWSGSLCAPPISTTYLLSLSRAVQVIFVIKKLQLGPRSPRCPERKDVQKPVSCRFICMHVIGGISNEDREVRFNCSLYKNPFQCISIWLSNLLIDHESQAAVSS